MESDLQQQFEDVGAHDIIAALKSMFETQARTERYNVSRALLGCKLNNGDPLSPHVIKMIGYVQSLERLGFPLSDEFATDVIMHSLPSVYGTFISNYHLHTMDKKLTKLHGILKTVEADIKRGSTNQVLMVQGTSKIKKSWLNKKAKSKGGSISDASPSAASVAQPAKSLGTVCFYCKEEGHWKRNCDKYHADKAKTSGSWTSDSCTVVVNVIDI
jgi:hypothetical protein